MWRTVIELFARSGKPPHLHEIGEETGLSAENLRTLVAELQAHDLLGSDPSADVVLYAYPFTGEQLSDHKLHTVCAIDALSVAGMFRTDVVIASSCRVCGGGIEVGSAQGGKSLSYARPVDAIYGTISPTADAQRHRAAGRSRSSAPRSSFSDG